MILYDILCLMVSLLWPFGLCFAATMATTASSDITKVIYNTEWYNFPHELRKYLPLMMARSQLQISFIGFGIVGCNLPNFVKVKTSLLLQKFIYSNQIDIVLVQLFLYV